MGALISLSKTETSTLLAVSEYALLAFALLVVIGLIGEHKLPWYHHRLHIFEVLVTIGCGGELLADGGVFLFSRHLETIANAEIAVLNGVAADARTRAANAEGETLKLQAQIQPRYLTEQQANGLVKAAKPFAGIGFMIVSHRTDVESQRLALQIKSTLNRAGMGLGTSSIDVGTIDRIAKFPDIPIGVLGGYTPDPTIHEGVEVWGNNAKAVEALLKALSMVAAKRILKPPAELAIKIPVGIFVGLKPGVEPGAVTTGTELRRLRSENSPRRLSEEQKKIFSKALESSSVPIAVAWNPLDNEARDLSQDLMSAFTMAHWTPVPMLLAPPKFNGVKIGSTEAGERPPTKSLRDALMSVGISAEFIQLTAGDASLNPPVEANVLYLLVGPHPPLSSR